jgi:hypothetical protein
VHQRACFPLLKMMPLDAVLAKGRVATLQALLTEFAHFMAPVAVGCCASDYKAYELSG